MAGDGLDTAILCGLVVLETVLPAGGGHLSMNNGYTGYHGVYEGAAERESQAGANPQSTRALPQWTKERREQFRIALRRRKRRNSIRIKTWQ